MRKKHHPPWSAISPHPFSREDLIVRPRAPQIRVRLPLTALAAAGLLIAGSLSAQQVRQAQRSPTFKPIGLYQLQLDGALDPGARIFHSAGLGTILVVSDQLSTVVELVPGRGKTFGAYSPDDFFRNVDGTYDKLPNVLPIEEGSFALNGDLPNFTVEGRRAEFTKKPPLLGSQQRAGLIEHDPTYGERSKLYSPIDQYIDMLKNVDEEVEVRIFFGSWCTVCAEFVPHILRVQETLSDTKVRFTFHGLPQSFDDPEAKKLKVTQVPTGIIFKGGEEIGRATGYSWQYPSMTIVNTLSRRQP